AGLLLEYAVIPDRSAIAHFLDPRATTRILPPVAATLHCVNFPFRVGRKRGVRPRFVNGHVDKDIIALTVFHYGMLPLTKRLCKHPGRIGLLRNGFVVEQINILTEALV